MRTRLAHFSTLDRSLQGPSGLPYHLSQHEQATHLLGQSGVLLFCGRALQGVGQSGGRGEGDAVMVLHVAADDGDVLLGK